MVVRTGGNVSNDTVGRRAELLKKIEASKGRIRRTQARIVARRLRVKTRATTKSGWLSSWAS